MNNRINLITEKIKSSKFAKDSFWAVFGNGLGYAFLLVSGIIIARIIGKDLYGEYGMVKSTMFIMAVFATFGLGDTSTKFVAEYLEKSPKSIREIIISCLKITLSFSSIICILLIVFSKPISLFVNEPRLANPFRFLGVIIIFRAIGTVCAGILGGLKMYKKLGLNNILSGASMFVICIPLTYLWGINGALVSLLTSQLLLGTLNFSAISRCLKDLPTCNDERFEKTIIRFSFPFALKELAFTVSQWGMPLLITKYASLGELGMYTACSQWNAIILFMPSLLGNVILSYLSTTAAGNDSSHKLLIRRMLMINFFSTLVPLIIVFIASPLIEAYYGPTFMGMSKVLSVLVVSTLFMCLSRVFHSNLMSEGRKWTAFLISGSYDMLLVLFTFILLKLTKGENAAMNLSILLVFSTFVDLMVYIVEYKIHQRTSVREQYYMY